MQSVLERLFKIANHLDQIGSFHYADKIDELLITAAGQHTRSVDNFIDELKRIFKIVAQSPNVPGINSENLETILKVIDTVASKGIFLEPSSSPEILKKIHKPDEELVQLVEGLVELESSIKQLQLQLVVEKNPIKKEQINKEMEKEHETVIKLMEEVNKLKDGKRKSDADQYNRFLKLYKQKKQELGLS